jgi:hypothetical protein
VHNADPIILRELDRSLAAHLAIVRAIVHLNFNESDQALDVLIGALSDYNFESQKEITYGNRSAAA